MKKLVGLFVIICAILASCEGRRSKNQALKNSIEEYNKRVNVQVDVFEPLNYSEREVDTIMSNGFRVKIKSYTDMNHSVLLTKIKDTINYQTSYRNFKFDIRVEKDGKLLCNETYNKQKVNELFGFNDKYLENDDLYSFNELAILKSINVIDYLENKDHVVVEVMYEIPETSRRSFHKIIIDNKGHIRYTKTKN